MIHARIGQPIDLTVTDDELTVSCADAKRQIGDQFAEAKARLDRAFPFTELEASDA